MTRQRFILLTLAPALTVLGLLAAVSTAGAVWFSVMNRALGSPEYEFVGLYNYLRLLRDKRFFNALEISLIWELVTVAGTLVAAVLLAVLVHETVKRAFWRNLIRFCLSCAGSAAPRGGSLHLAVSLFAIAWPAELDRRRGRVSPDRVSRQSVAGPDFGRGGRYLAMGPVLHGDHRQAAGDHATRPDRGGDAGQRPDMAGSCLCHPADAERSVDQPCSGQGVKSLRSFDLDLVMTGGGPGTATETLDLYAYLIGKISTHFPLLPTILKLFSATYIVFLAIRLWKTANVS